MACPSHSAAAAITHLVGLAGTSEALPWVTNVLPSLLAPGVGAGLFGPCRARASGRSRCVRSFPRIRARSRPVRNAHRMVRNAHRREPTDVRFTTEAPFLSSLDPAVVADVVGARTHGQE